MINLDWNRNLPVWSELIEVLFMLIGLLQVTALFGVCPLAASLTEVPWGTPGHCPALGLEPGTLGLPGLVS